MCVICVNTYILTVLHILDTTMTTQHMTQLRFLDTFVKIFGFTGLDDYTSLVSVATVDADYVVKCVNMSMGDIKANFKAGSLNLSRKKYKVDSVGLAFSVLRNCLQ